MRLEDGKDIPAQGVIWATGYHSDYKWIKLPIFDDIGRPMHERGVISQAPGISFVGLNYQTGVTSALLSGVGNDAKYITSLVH